ELGRFGRVALAVEAGRESEAGEPGLPGRGIDDDIGRFDVFVDDAPAVHPAKRGRKTHGESQEQPELYRRLGRCPGTEPGADRRSLYELVQQLALLVLENEGRTALVLREGERPNSPRRIELGPQGQLAFQHPQVFGPWMFRGQHRYEN